MKGQLYDRMSRSASRLTGQNVRGLTSLKLAIFHDQFPLLRGGGSKLPRLYTLPIYDFDLRATHARTLLLQHWLLCHLGLYLFEFEFELVLSNHKETSTNSTKLRLDETSRTSMTGLSALLRNTIMLILYSH